ncbi:hypothetical protein E2562_020325 [Oryza meyeriana var. granulata]|uniref:Fe2OG dioxygenase domain-containing protein n=1 Tax=Oryza meyeriana var. granulata TaxID=110450 RepID=A0A6G1ED48_9ORYZ|nr:hypothetical protein E2562_020325 [Oryza meyeriana var. granulata]
MAGGAGNRLDLPVVDLSSSDIAPAAESIRKACVEYGFFYVINHGVEEGLLEKVFAESKKYFEQPLEEKMALRWNSCHLGHTPPYTEKLDASSKFEGELNENFSVGPIGDKDSQNDANQWPSEGEVNKSDYGNYGASAHSDYGILTILVTDGTPGLQICREKDRHPQLWEDVHHIDGSTLHRVVAVGKERYSVALFLNPNPNLVVECLKSCCSKANPPRFPPIKGGDYLKQRLNATYK